MSLLSEVEHLVTADWGWIVAVSIFLYQVTWPGWETQLQQLLANTNDDLRSDIATVHNRLQVMNDAIEDIQTKQLSQIQVIRALAATDENIDNDAVDEYLAENGVSKDYFFADKANRFGSEDYDSADD